MNKCMCEDTEIFSPIRLLNASSKVSFLTWALEVRYYYFETDRYQRIAELF